VSERRKSFSLRLEAISCASSQTTDCPRTCPDCSHGAVQHARTEGELEINATCVGRCARSASAELSPLNVTVALGSGEAAVATGEVDHPMRRVAAQAVRAAREGLTAPGSGLLGGEGHGASSFEGGVRPALRQVSKARATHATEGSRTKAIKPTSPGMRHRVVVQRDNLHKGRPFKPLTQRIPRSAGRDRFGDTSLLSVSSPHWLLLVSQKGAPSGHLCIALSRMSPCNLLCNSLASIFNRVLQTARAKLSTHYVHTLS
jgi:hypothetical protein